MGRKISSWTEEDFVPGKINWVPETNVGMPKVPPEAKVNPLVLASLCAVYAVDMADDESADPDWALEIMEQMYDYLGRANRTVLLRELDKLIAHAQQGKWPRKLVTMLKKDRKHFATSAEDRKKGKHRGQ
jgi:hypothetical protein